MQIQSIGMAYILPETILAVGAMAILLVDLLVRNKTVTAGLSLALLAATGFAIPAAPAGAAFSGMFVVDGYATFFKWIFLINAAFAVIVSGDYLRDRGEMHGEYYGLVLFSTLGMMIMASARDLITLYLGLELMALSTYVLAGFLRADKKSNEAAVKYLLLGAFSSAILLYGISLIYGLTGTTEMLTVASRIREAGLADGAPVLLLALLFFVVSFGFKIAAAPFHMWAPDVYEGAPTPVTAFMSVGPKAAGFAVMGRVFMLALAPLQADWSAILTPVAILTMGVGNVLALSQNNIKRMLAYSSIAHAGYALLGVIAGTEQGLSSMMNYMMIYAFMNVGAFAMVLWLERAGVWNDKIENFKGLSKTSPVAAFLMLLFMFSLTGIPPTAGFVGKFYLFMSALATGHLYAVIAAAIFSAVSAYFYLRIVRLMYMEAPDEGAVAPGGGPKRAPVGFVLAVTAVAVVAIGLFPDALLAFARSAVGQ